MGSDKNRGAVKSTDAASVRLEKVEQSVRHLFRLLLESRRFKVSELVSGTGIAIEKIRAIAGLETGSGIPRANNSINIDQVAKLVKFCENSNIGGNNPSFAVGVNSEFDNLRLLLDPKQHGSSSFSLYPFDVSSLVDLQAPDVAEIAVLEGLYLTFRRVPTSDKVLVSAVEVAFDSDSGLLLWNNTHPVSSNTSLLYRGVVASQGNHFLFLGQRDDFKYVNLFSLRRPASRVGLLHGIGFLETDNEPVVCRICFVEKAGATNLAGLVKHCGSVNIKTANQLGLPKASYVDILPYNDEQEINVDNRRAVVAHSYAHD